MKSNRKYAFLEKIKNPNFFLKLAVTCRHNSIVLKDTAKLAFQNEHGVNHGLFLLHTASEELQKGIFCLFVHRGFMKPSQILLVFTEHRAKIILFEKIFRSGKSYFKNGQFYLDGVLLQDIDFEILLKKNESFGRKYMNHRNKHIYVTPLKNGHCYTPSKSVKNAKNQWEEINDELTALNFLFVFVWRYEVIGDLDNFNYYKLKPKNKKATHHVMFSGGQVIERQNFRPKWLDRYAKQLDRKFKTKNLLQSELS